VPYGDSPASDRPPGVGVNVGVLLGDANGDGVTDNGEVTLSVPWLAADELVCASTSNKNDARLNLLQQAIAAQLNIDNHDADPGLLSASDGYDLLGTAVKWLTGKLPFSDGNPVPSNYNVDGDGNGILDSGPNTSFEFDTKNGSLYSGGSVDFVATSTSDWSAKQVGNFSKDGYFVVVDHAQTSSLLGGYDVVATGEDLKNALSAFNMNQLVTELGGSEVAWDSNGVISDVQANTQDGLWKVLTDHHIGLLAPTVTV